MTALVLPGSAAVAADAAGRAPTLRWAPCPEDATADCATLRVPIDWDRPHGATVGLALARRKATDRAARIGSLLINPGGPGGSGVDFAIFGPGYFSDEIRRRFDIVGFDPRGVARSHPVVCSLDLLLASPSPVLTSQADFDAMVAYNRRLGRDCRRRTGPLFDHVDSVSVARDMDAIRAAVGDRRLSYYGVSYGTLMGQMYAELFPHRVRALALDSNMDHSLGTRDFLNTEAVTAEDSFDEFVAWCDRTAGCSLHGRDVHALWADLLARAARGELPNPFDPTAPPLTPLDLRNIIFGAFYGPEWFELADLLGDLDAGTPTATALALNVKGFAARGEVAENPFQAVFCEDWALPIRDFREFAGHMRRMAALAPDLGYSVLGLGATMACLGWPARVNNPQHRLDVRHAPRLLLENAKFDPATAYSWATNAARQLGRGGVLLTYDGWGHGVYGRGPCPTVAIDRYLIDRILPAADQHCPAIEPEPVSVHRAPGLPRLPVGPRPGVPGWGS